MVHIRDSFLLAKILWQEGPYFFPTVHCLLLPIGGAVIIEEAMSGAVIAVKLVVLAVLLELRLMLVHLLRRRTLVIVAKKAEQRAGEILRVIDRRDRLLRSEILFGHHHAPAPAFDGRVEALHAAGGEEGMAPSGASAEDAYLTVQIGL